MFSFKLKYVFKAISCVIYVSLLYLGCYFISEGKVWERFQHKKTSFAEYTESLTELPSVTAWIEYAPKNATSSDLRLGVNFNISYQRGNYSKWEWENETTLNEGENNISGISLMLGADFDPWGYHMYRLTPLNFDREVVIYSWHILAFRFANQSVSSKVSKIMLALSTKNNSYCGWGTDLYDGNVHEAHARPGERRFLSINPQKILYSSEVEECRGKPFSEMLLRETTKLMNQNCSTICKPKTFYLCNDITEHTQIPVCQNTTEEQCFEGVETYVRKQVPLKPCTKFEYNIEESESIDPVDTLSLGFLMEFQKPPRVTVKEEYLVFDLVSMISAIGGTMGLCIGFSFLDLARLCLEYLEDGYDYIKGKFGCSGQIGRIETISDQVTMEDVRRLMNEHRIETDEKLSELKKLLHTIKKEVNKIKDQLQSKFNLPHTTEVM